MRIKFIIPKSASDKTKCTVHQNGKLGFSQDAIKTLNINERTHVKIGINADDNDDSCLYMQIIPHETNDAYKVNKAGNYYYLNTRQLFEDLKVDYKTKKIIYDIEDFSSMSIGMYKLNRRDLDRKKKK